MKQISHKEVWFMMKRRSGIKIAALLILSALSAGSLFGSDILKILEGYGRDSIATFSTRDAQSEAARLFNLILEPNGEITVEKAEQYLSDGKSPVIRAYLAVMLADYAFVNKHNDSGLRYLKRAVEEHDPIRNDSYYRLVLSRAQNIIKESPGKEQENKTSVLETFAPKSIKTEPIVKVAESAKTQAEENPAEPPPAKENEAIPQITKEINFRIQVGAFSVQENALRKQEYFIKNNYPVDIAKRERSSGYLYLVRIGEYETYDEAKQALSELKNKYPAEAGIVVKVEK